MIQRNYDSPVRRLRQLERVLLLAELLAPLQRGASIAELTRDVGEILAVPYCTRTIRRDLIALEELGVVESRPQEHELTQRRGWRVNRWRWVERSVRSAIFHRMAMIREGQIESWSA